MPVDPTPVDPESASEPPDPALDALVRAWDTEAGRDGMADTPRSHPADDALAASVNAHVQAAAAAAAVPVDVDAAWARVRAQMEPAATGGAASGAPAPAVPRLTVVRGDGGVRTASRRVALVAAAAVVALAVGLRVGERRRARPTVVAQRVTTGIGQQDSIRLSDGTRVLLAPGSRLDIAAGFDAGDRVVTLTGTAYFSVHHDAAHPFTVRAGAAVIRDIGTAFTVRTGTSAQVAVAVTHGTVELGTVSSANPVALHAGDRATLATGTIAVRRGAVVPEDTSWTLGRLAYRDAALTDVQADLQRWYGITLAVPDPALQRLTITMPPQPDAASTIRTVAAALGAVAEQRGDSVILRPAGARVTP